MRGIVCRGLRLELVAGLGIALAMPALAVAAEELAGLGHADHADRGDPRPGRTHAGHPGGHRHRRGRASRHRRRRHQRPRNQLAGAALNAQGQANLRSVLCRPATTLCARSTRATARHSGVQSPSRRGAGARQHHAQFHVSVAPATLTLYPRPIRNGHRLGYACEQLRADGPDVRHALLLRTSRSVLLQLYAGEHRDPAQRHRPGYQLHGPCHAG